MEKGIWYCRKWKTDSDFEKEIMQKMSTSLGASVIVTIVNKYQKRVHFLTIFIKYQRSKKANSTMKNKL